MFFIFFYAHLCDISSHGVAGNIRLFYAANLQNVGGCIGGEFYGMNTFDQSLARLYKEGFIDLETAQSAATSPDAIMLAIRGVTGSLEAVNE